MYIHTRVCIQYAYYAYMYVGIYNYVHMFIYPYILCTYVLPVEIYNTPMYHLCTHFL